MSSTVVVTNLPSHTTEETLRIKFSEFGELNEVEMNKDPDTGRCLGNASVAFDRSYGAHASIEAMNNQEFEGQTINVIIALDEPGS